MLNLCLTTPTASLRINSKDRLPNYTYNFWIKLCFCRVQSCGRQIDNPHVHTWTYFKALNMKTQKSLDKRNTRPRNRSRYAFIHFQRTFGVISPNPEPRQCMPMPPVYSDTMSSHSDVRARLRTRELGGWLDGAEGASYKIGEAWNATVSPWFHQRRCGNLCTIIIRVRMVSESSMFVFCLQIYKHTYAEGEGGDRLRDTGIKAIVYATARATH